MGDLGSRSELWGNGDAPRVDHVDAVLERDAHDVLLREVGSDGGEACPNLICLVCLSTPTNASLCPEARPRATLDRHTFCLCADSLSSYE